MKEYTTEEFAVTLRCSKHTVSKWRITHRGRPPQLIPARYEGRKAVYTEEQIPLALALLDKKKTFVDDNSGNLFGSFTADDTQADRADDIETDGSEEDADEETFTAIIPADDDDPDDDELIDPPAELPAKNDSDAVAPMKAITPKDFLPMTTAPNFDKIPQGIKALSRFMCWQLRLKPTPEKPDAKTKIPMTPKYGKLVNADITAPENWLMFEESISWFNRGLCSGIGLVLTNKAPKLCCVDVDHCINPDGSLNDEAKAVIALCGNSWVEISQSGTGIHVWFIDNEFPGERGRKKGNIEVYAFGRYIAMTGNHIAGTADDLLTVNGACRLVIKEFIDADIDKPSLFDESARTPEIHLEIKNAAQMSDADKKIVEYFRSDKCRERDLNMFDLFSGNTADYFKNTGKPVDDSVADEHLMLKILYYVGNEGTDAEIGQRALKIFGQSALAKRGKWEREDYQLRTINAALKHWTQNGRKSYQPDEDATPIDSLKANLREAQKELADFNAEKDTAFEKLRDCQAFDNTTVFSAEIIKAAAFAKNYDAELYSAFARDVKQYGDKHKDVKADMNSWKGSVKNKALELDARRCDLVTRINQLRAQIETMKFAASSDMLIPTLPDYQITQEFGIAKVSGEKLIPVAPRPIVISSQVKSVDSGILKFQLAQMTPKGKWQKFPTFDAATISDSRAIVKLSNAGLRVTSNNAALLVDYFDKLRTQLEEDLPMTYEVARCGWHEFDGKEYFIDPRRPCVFSDDDDKNISVEVSSQSQFATCLTTRGSLDKWREAYELAKKYPVARFMTATAVSPILLKVLGERNFLTYVFGKTRGGKTTAATLASSTGGDEKIIRSFDATKNGLAGAAADVSDYCFIVDEKQVADNKLKETFDNVIYAIANGIGRLRLNKDGSVRKVQDWRTIALMTGETRMIEDNTIGGADTRLLSINAGDEVMPPDVCKQIRAIVKNNCGHALPLVIDKTQSKSPEFWQEAYEDIQKVFAEDYPDHLDEHRRYIATVTLGDAILNDALYGSGEAALLDAIGNAKEIFKLIPLTAEFDTTQREIDFVRDFVSRNQNQFISVDNKIEFIRGGVFGKLEEVFVYIAVGVLKDACKSAGFDYGKLVDDLVAAGYFVPDDKTTDKVKTPYKFVLKKLGKTPTRCFRINRDRFDE